MEVHAEKTSVFTRIYPSEEKQAKWIPTASWLHLAKVSTMLRKAGMEGRLSFQYYICDYRLKSSHSFIH